jgi:hypothetical protein
MGLFQKILEKINPGEIDAAKAYSEKLMRDYEQSAADAYNKHISMPTASQEEKLKVWKEYDPERYQTEKEKFDKEAARARGADDEKTVQIDPKKVAAIAPMANPFSSSDEMNPANLAKKGLGYYEKAKDALYRPLANQLDLTKDKSATDDMTDALKTIGDPVNFVPGGAGVALGAMQMATPKFEKIQNSFNPQPKLDLDEEEE